MSNHTLYLTISRGRWGHPKIRRVSRKRPTTIIGEAIVRVDIDLPSGILNPPVVNVVIKPEHVAQPVVVATPVKP
jgi:hypothetical protein